MTVIRNWCVHLGSLSDTSCTVTYVVGPRLDEWAKSLVEHMSCDKIHGLARAVTIKFNYLLPLLMS
jgi:hypothetical protein